MCWRDSNILASNFRFTLKFTFCIRRIATASVFIKCFHLLLNICTTIVEVSLKALYVRDSASGLLPPWGSLSNESRRILWAYVKCNRRWWWPRKVVLWRELREPCEKQDMSCSCPVSVCSWRNTMKILKRKFWQKFGVSEMRVSLQESADRISAFLSIRELKKSFTRESVKILFKMSLK